MVIDAGRHLRAKVRGMQRTVKQAERKWGNLCAPDYVRDDLILCKKCGSSIMEGGQPSPAFAELRLIFDDNSAHVTSVCRKCAAGLRSEELEGLYCADLLALAKDEEAQGRLMHWELLSDRRVIGYERV